MGGEVISKNYEEYVSVYVGDEGMSADLFLVEEPSENFYNLIEVLTFIKSKGVVYGVDVNSVKQALEEKKYGEFIHFATGRPVEAPQNGYYDYKFNPNPSKAPKLKEDGSVDYYNLDLVEVVEKGQLVVEYIPKKDGVDGITVRGEKLIGKKAADLAPLRGKGFYVSEDRRYYYSEMDGKVEIIMGALTISAMHTISGDVSLATGNIDFKGDLVITGNITAEMQVRATGNITVEGLVETARVEAGKDILVKGGILGGGKAVIKAGGNVYAKFIENTTVESKRSVQADSILNSNVTAYNDINVMGKTSGIMGGMLRANRYIRTKVIGSDKGVTTIMEVGIPANSQADRKRYSEEVKDKEAELQKVEKILFSLSKSGNEESEIYIQATRTKIELIATISKYRNNIKKIDDILSIARNAEISAEQAVYPGTRVYIDGIRLDVEEEYGDITFFRKGDRVLTRRFEDKEEEIIELMEYAEGEV